MRRNVIVVITLFVLSCSLASAQTFGFMSADEFVCNYVQINNKSGFGPAVWQGVDNLSACGMSHNATLTGMTTNLSKLAGLPVSGNGIFFADNLYDAFSYAETGMQWGIFMVPKCSTKKKTYGWIGFASVSGVIFGDNYGTVTCEIPGPGTASHRTYAGPLRTPKQK